MKTATSSCRLVGNFYDRAWYVWKFQDQLFQILSLSGRKVLEETFSMEPALAFPTEPLFFQVWIPEGIAC